MIKKNAGGETEIYRTNLKKSGEKEKRSPMESPEILEIKEENQEERKKITWKYQNQENKTIEKKGNKKGNGSSIVESATETMLEKTRKTDRFSSSGSDTQENEKRNKGTINCICLYQTYDPDMVKCISCGEFSHGTCYRAKVSEKFECAGCSIKQGRECGKHEIDSYYKKKHRSRKDKHDFVFQLNRRRVLKSILNQEFINCQPGKEPSTEFMKIRFGFSSSYAAKITLDLVKCGLINIFGEFSFDGGKIIEELGLHDDLSEDLSEDEIQRETDNLAFEVGALFNTEIIQEMEKLNPATKRVRSKSPSDVQYEKKSKMEKPKNTMNTPVGKNSIQEERNQTLVINTDNSTISSPSNSDMEIKKKESPEKKKGKREISKDSQISQDYEEDGEKDENSKLDQKIRKDRENRKYKIKYSWPTRFINNESRDAGKDVPVSVATLGKRTSNPVYGQITDITEPRQNTNDPSKWNLHFILGMDGQLTQCWIFGAETEIKEMSKSLEVEEYYLFWGDFTIKDKYSSKFKHTNDWAMYIQGASNKFGRIKRTRVYIESGDSKSEEREKFAEKFQPAPRKGKVLKKKKEHDARMKGKLETNQKKITAFGVTTRSRSGTSGTSEEEIRKSPKTDEKEERDD